MSSEQMEEWEHVAQLKRVGVVGMRAMPGVVDENRSSARVDAVVVGHTKIVALDGIKLPWETELRQEAWWHEPRAGLESVLEVGWWASDSMRSEAHRGKLWRIIESGAKELGEEWKSELDLQDLSPWQASRLVMRIITKRMKYEYGIVDDMATLVRRKQTSGGEITGDRRLVELARLGKQKEFRLRAKWLEIKIDLMEVGELLDYGYGVCRHLGKAAAVMYSVLKEKQLGLKLNGTYLTYFSEEIGREKGYWVTKDHGYNMLVVTRPGGEIELAVIDLTWAVNYGDESQGDRTMVRLSQGIRFLERFGPKYWGVRGEDLGELREKCLVRLVQQADLVRNAQDWTELGELVNDMAALMGMADVKGEERVMTAENYHKASGDEVEILTRLLAIPAWYISGEDQLLYPEVVQPLVKRMGKVKLGFRDTELFKVWLAILVEKNLNGIDRIMRLRKIGLREFGKFTRRYGYDELARFYRSLVDEYGWKRSSRVWKMTQKIEDHSRLRSVGLRAEETK